MSTTTAILIIILAIIALQAFHAWLDHYKPKNTERQQP